jgi:hypothetical protein
MPSISWKTKRRPQILTMIDREIELCALNGDLYGTTESGGTARLASTLGGYEDN